VGNTYGQGLEQTLARTEADAEATLKAANSLTRCLRRLRTAARVGDLREIHSSVDAADKAISALRQQFVNSKEGWDFDEQHYLAEGLYAQELIAKAQEIGLSIFERDDRLYSYPALLRISPSDRAVYIDRKREARIRPSVLVTRLKELQRKPPSFKPEALLEALHKAYTKAVAMRRRELIAPVVPLMDLYDLLTMLPGQARDYTKQEFARDVYLLHRSGVDTTRTGSRVSFPASTSTKTPSRTLSVITDTGEEKRYYGICFTQPARE